MDTISIGRPAIARRPARSLLGRLALPRVLAALWRDWTARAEQRRALAALDDRMLRDVGLNRGDVARELAKPPWRI
ncbi:MAG: DUF1127 domain-containing protein [Alphaproteobacteria bacterium]|nr:DUF1127 domain-containing protein [Alphaproteobacteria bacterium]